MSLKSPSIPTAHFHTRATELKFDASSETLTAHLPGTLTASKPGGPYLELSAGVGLSSTHLAQPARSLK